MVEIAKGTRIQVTPSFAAWLSDQVNVPVADDERGTVVSSIRVSDHYRILPDNPALRSKATSDGAIGIHVRDFVVID